MSFKSSKYCKIYEYVSVDQQNRIVTAGNNASQRKTGYRFVIAAMRLILLIGIMYTLILIYGSIKQQMMVHMLPQIMLLLLMAVIQSSKR